MRLRSLTLGCAVALSALTACGSNNTMADQANTSPATTSPVTTSAGSETAPSTAPAAAGSVADAADYTWDESDVAAIELTGTSATSKSGAVKISGSAITITATGTYRVSGSLTDGQVVVDTDDDGIVRVILDGAHITNTKTSPFTVTEAKQVVVILADGSQNELSDGSTYTFADATTDEPNATLFSTADLAIAGNGTLTVDGNFNDAIASKDGLVIAGGTIVVDAADDGIRGKDHVIVEGGTITVRAAGDAIKADNEEDSAEGYVAISGGTFDLTSGGDAIDAATTVTISDGKFTVKSGNGSSASVAQDASAKAIKGATSVKIDGGTFTIDSADDAIHSNNTVAIVGGMFSIRTGDDGIHADAKLTIGGGTIDITKSYEGIESAAITVSGGDISINASDDGVNGSGGIDGSGAQEGARGQDNFAQGGSTSLTITGGRLAVIAAGDGIDINGSITMSAGTVIVHGPTANNNAALDYDGTFALSGGVVVASGSAGMAQSPGTGSTQATVSVRLTTAQAAGTLVRIQSANGDQIFTFAPTKSFQSIVVSTPAVVNGTAYDVYVGGSSTGAVNDGVYEGGTSSGGTKVATVTASMASTSTGGMSGPGAR